MTHLLVTQLRFARSELQRALEGVSDEDARRRVKPMNCISWMIGHLANQEHYYWVELAQGKTVVTGLNKLVGSGKPATRPPLDEMWATWNSATRTADFYLDTLTPEILALFFEREGKPLAENIGTLLQRTLFHYWFHIGESMAVRQLLGHTGLPEFVGKLGEKSPYHPESEG